MNRFLSFCNHRGTTPFPVSENLLCYFVAFLAQQGLAPSTIKTYLAGVRHAQIIRGHPEPRESSTLPRLKLLQAGVKRVRAQQGAPPSRPRLPLTPAHLRQIRTVWNTSASNPDIVMLWAAATMCFFGFFRAGEITVASAAAYDPIVHLSWGDISVDSIVTPSAIRIHLKRSKCDQLGNGVDVVIGRTTDELCPVTAVLTYMAQRGDQAGAFFRVVDGSPLTKARFVSSVRRALAMAGVDCSPYSGHSFRIGAATAAALAGIEDSTIQALGRWSSNAFLRYIRTPPDSLARFSSSLSRV